MDGSLDSNCSSSSTPELPLVPSKPSFSSAPSSPTLPAPTAGPTFKTDLQVLLKSKYSEELVKNIEYKDQLEHEDKGNLDDDEAKDGKEMEGNERNAKDTQSEVDISKHEEVIGDKDINSQSTNAEILLANTKKQSVRIYAEIKSKDHDEITKDQETKANVELIKQEQLADKNSDDKTVKESLKDVNRLVEGTEKDVIDESTNGDHKSQREKQSQSKKEKESRKNIKAESYKTKEDKIKKRTSSKTKEDKCTKSPQMAKQERTPGKDDKDYSNTHSPKASLTRDKSDSAKTQGMLHKKGKGPLGTWKRYYFILSQDTLLYYKGHQDCPATGPSHGNLDLALFESVCAKKPGRMKSHYPFVVARRNHRDIVLAADTEEDRERWMDSLHELLASHHPIQNQLSVETVGHDSKDIDKSDKMNQDQEKKVEDIKEEPKLIQPKKLQRVGIGPMANISIGEVKLKKIDSKHTFNPEEKQSIEISTEHTFGVKLKPVTIKPDTCDNETEPSATHSLKRPSKHAVIPLSKSPLLSRPSGGSMKVSPETHRKPSLERKKSPSPSIPLSKGVHSVLAKSNDDVEVSETTKDEIIENINAVSRESNETFCTNQQCNDQHETEEHSNITIDDNNQVIQQGEDTERVLKTLPTDPENLSDHVIKINIIDDNSGNICESVKEMNIQVVEQSSCESRAQENDESCRGDAESSESKSANETITGNIHAQHIEDSYTKVDATRYEKLLEEKDLTAVPLADKEPEVTAQLVETDDGYECDQSDEETVQSLKLNVKSQLSKTDSNRNSPETVSGSPKTGKSWATPPMSPFRKRADTASSSHNKSDTDSLEKKTGKFKLFKRGRSNSIDVGQAQRDQKHKQKQEKQKESSEVPYKSSAFSKIMPSLKSKGKTHFDKFEDHDKDNLPKKGNDKNIEEDCHGSSDEVENFIKEKSINQIFPKTPSIIIGEPEGNLAKGNAEPVVIMRRRLTNEDTPRSRCSRNSSTSREEVPPDLPEKHRTREKSPAHDIPRSNRPITNFEIYAKQEKTKSKQEHIVDGNISLEQINAILSAKEVQEKKRQSLSRNPGCLTIESSDSSDTGNSHRPSYISLTSVESDEPLPKTNFLNDQLSVSSGSLRRRSGDYSSSNESHHRLSGDIDAYPMEQELGAVSQRTKITDSLTQGARVSLTLPEFTVMEEDCFAILKENKDKDCCASSTDSSESTDDSIDKSGSSDESKERVDYFPVVGGVEFRRPVVAELLPQQSELAEMRTSGIIGLKAFIGEMGEAEEDEQLGGGRAGISRLGHSAAVEKLKEELSSESNHDIN